MRTLMGQRKRTSIDIAGGELVNVFRSRVMVTLIGLIIVGGISAWLTVALSSQPTQTALVGVSGTTTPGAGARVATATATATARAATPTPRPAATQGSQYASLRGVVANPNASAGTFVVNRNGSPVTVTVTSTTTFHGVATSMSTLTAGLRVTVQGTSQGNGSFLAVNVYTNSDN